MGSLVNCLGNSWPNSHFVEPAPKSC